MGLFTRQTSRAMQIAESTKLTREEKDRAFEELLMEMHMEGAVEERERLSSVDIDDLLQQMYATDKMLAVTIAHAGIETESICEGDKDFERYAKMTPEERDAEFRKLNGQVITISEKAMQEVWEREQRMEELENAQYAASVMSVVPLGEVYSSMLARLGPEEQEQAQKLLKYFKKYFRDRKLNRLVGTVANLGLVLSMAERVEKDILEQAVKKS